MFLLLVLRSLALSFSFCFCSVSVLFPSFQEGGVGCRCVRVEGDGRGVVLDFLFLLAQSCLILSGQSLLRSLPLFLM